MKKNILLIALLILAQLSRAQTLNRDSLLKLLPVAKEDTHKVKLLYTIAEQIENDDPEKAMPYIAEAGKLSELLEYKTGLMRYCKRMIYVYAILSKNDSAIYFGKKLLEIAKQNGDSLNMGLALFNIGERFSYKANYDSGLQYTLAGIKLLEGRGYAPKVEGAVLGSIAVTYLMMKNYEKSIEYGLKAAAIERKMDNKSSLSGTLINLANCYGEINNLTESEKLYLEALDLVKLYNMTSHEIMVYQGLTDLAEKKNAVGDIKLYAEKGLDLSKKLNDEFGIMAGNQGLALYYLRTNKFDLAKQYGFEALKITEKNNFLEAKAAVLKTLANVHFAAHDFLNASKYEKQAQKITESLFTETIAQKDADLRLKYETEKKDTQLKLQQATIRQKNTLNYILAGGAVALIIISLLTYRNYHNTQKLQQQRISELETEKQLTATEAVLKGEEQERTRLAKDLHDGLGGMLSGIKFSLNTMKGNLIMTPENAQAFERSIDMLDSSIQEMRRVAHNMMPEALVKFGLDDALKDFCNDINNSGALQINYQSIGLKSDSVKQTTAIAIYRIVQELINNTLKHAVAKTALVQLTVEQNKLTLTVEDDGNGFDVKILNKANGIGWQNIKNRVDFLKGSTDVHSQTGKGTSVYIEVPIT